MTTPRTVKPFFLDIDASDRAYLHDSLDKILDSSTLILGPYTDAFERAFAEYVGTRHAVSLNSATSALEVQLRLEGVQDKLVAVPTNTNFATAAAVLHAGGRLLFVDMDAHTFMPNLELLKDAKERRPELAGIVWVHIGGVISPDMTDIARYCKDQGMFLIEDCAHAHGSLIGGRHAGTFGVSGAFSFFPTKVMTTMEGGMIVTDDEAYAAAIRSYRNQGKRAGIYNALHVDLGSSWRLSEFAAAFGVVQLSKLDAMVQRRAQVAAIYEAAFDALGLAYVRTGHMDRCSNYKVVAVLPASVQLDEAKARFAKEGVVLGGGVYEVPCHAQPVFAGLSTDEAYPVADALCGRQFCLPITSGMSLEDAHYVVGAMQRVLAT